LGYPGYTGSRPSVQVWHGTIDTALSVQTGFWEAIKQWSNVFGYSQTPISNVSMSGFPDGYSNATYGPKFQAILAQGVGHTVPVFEDLILEFFGL
jgi:acetylxylan esterase